MPTTSLKHRPLRWIIAAAVLVVLLVVALITVFTLRAAASFTLQENAPTSATPRFTSNADAVAGWQKQQDELAEEDPLPVVNYVKSKSSCKMLTSSSFLPASSKSRGDAFNSETALYQNGTNNGALIKKEAPLYIKASDGKRLQVDTGRYTFSQGGQKVVAYVATRAFNSAYNNPLVLGDAATGKDIYGLPLGKGVPVVTVLYYCNQKDASRAEFQQLVSAVHLNLR